MSDPVTRLNAALEGRYRIERELGEGGMATVYLADDLKHERKVALKVLKPELAAVVGAERFLAEIKTTANLQHPHILPLFDSGEAEGFLFYVMPYIQGETLRERIDRERQLPVDEALGIATAVANALHAAHEQGVVHRDIKPGNILLSRDQPLVADFGIALAVSVGGGGRLTETGLSLGTPYYMSPEQATGDQAIGPASDTFALACVLYEMLVGEPPYSGNTAQAVLGKIIQGIPVSATAVRQSVPKNVDAAIRKALEKIPADRFTGAQSFAKALADPAFRHGAAATIAESPPTGPWNRLSLTMTGVAALTTALAAWGWLRSPAASEAPVTTRSTVSGVDLGTSGGGWRLAISPNGRTLLKVMDDQFYTRRADDTEWRPLSGTLNARDPTFSPDGAWVAFDAGSTVQKVSIDGGPALPVTAGSGDNPNWGNDDLIVFTREGALYVVSPSGGDERLLFSSDSISVVRPHLLPGGRGVVFGTGVRASSRLVVVNVETGEAREIASAGNQPRYVPTGHLLYGHPTGALMGQAFDVETLEIVGPPVTLLPRLAIFGGGASQFAVSENGTLLYSVPAAGDDVATDASAMTWLDLEGNRTPIPLRQPGVTRPKISPDGERIAYEADNQVWVYHVATGTNTQLTFEGTNVTPVWARDGSEVYYLSVEDGTADGFARAIDGSSEPRRLWAADREERALTSVSPDGRFVVVAEVPGSRDISLVSLDGDSATFRDYLRADSEEFEGAVSPNGRWLAYTSMELGAPQVFVRGFPEPTGQWRVSVEGGFDPVWSPDGKALYFVFPPNIMRADVTTEGGFSPAQPVPLTDWGYDSGGGLTHGWDIHPDGDRLLVVTGSTATGGFGEVFLVTNWFEELRQRMGGG